MLEIFQKIQLNGIVPVVKLDNLDDALPLVGALSAGGLDIAEITFRTGNAAKAIKLIKKKCPQITIGAGTVITTDQVLQAIDSGAEFVVTPGFNPKVVDKCLEEHMPIIPGCSAASQIEQALERNIKLVKFFPAEECGGLNMINALSEPFPMVKFLPTGGINLTNLNSYLNHPKVIACADNFLVKDEWLKEGKFDEITRATRFAINKMLDFGIHHIAINSSPSEGSNLLKSFKNFLGLPDIENQISFAGSDIEVVKNPKRGEKGHIAFRTSNLERAINYLEKRGFTIDIPSMIKDDGSRLIKVYFNETIGGFALHLIKDTVSRH